ncbi:MAG: fibronectin type III domain-containing protein [Patescibacteria group bacterium]
MKYGLRIKNKSFEIGAIILTVIVLFVPVFQIYGENSETGVNLDILLECNNDGVCGIGENTSNCPLDCPPSPPPSTPDTTPPIIYNLSILRITLNSAEVSWETNELALCQFFWGQTEEYKQEIILEDNFLLDHSVLLKNLSAGTTYHFKISCKDGYQNTAETADQKFTTLFPPDITPPVNVSNFTAIPGDSQIELQWKNPVLQPGSGQADDFNGVKIMRSTSFYPEDPWTGMPVYNGKGESFTDTGLENGVRYYYTAFAYDKAGNYSSGAIVSAVPAKPGIVIPPPEIPTSTIPVPPEIDKLTIDDFDFVQEGKKIVPDGGRVKLEPQKPLEISLGYEKVPEVLKTIMITLEDPYGKTFSFLLRINKEKTRYEAVILAPEPGVYPLTITILDYKNKTLKRITGFLVIAGGAEKILPGQKKCKIWPWILLLLLILTAIYLYKRRKKKKNNPNQNLKYNRL